MLDLERRIKDLRARILSDVAALRKYDAAPSKHLRKVMAANERELRLLEKELER